MTPDPIPTKPFVPPFEKLTLTVAAIAVFICLLIAVTAPHPLFLAPFRESQTAITADYLNREPAGGMMASQLPVLGVPWQIPLEFPIFQRATAWLAAGGVDVAQAGRIVSAAGFVVCLLVGAGLWRALALPKQWRPLALAFFAASPIYIFYATSHMIESWALMFALLLWWGALRLIQGGNWLWLAVVVFAGALAAMVKITTWLPAAMLLSLYLLGVLYDRWKKGDWKSLLPRWLALVVGIGIGLVAGGIWTVWATRVRDIHGKGTGGSDEWVFGGIHDRLSITNWVLVAVKDLSLLFGPLGILVPVLIILAWWKGAGAANRLNRCMAFSLVGFFIHALLFIKLLLRHDYYIFGSGFFIVLAALCACMVLAETFSSKWVRILPVALVISMLTGGLLYGILKRGYHDYVVDEAIPAVAKIKDPGAIVTFGFDWSPRLPFEVGRKALMIVDTDEKVVAKQLDRNHDVPMAAVVVIGNQYDHMAQMAAQKFGLDAEHRVPFWSNGYLLVRPGAAAELTANIQSIDQPILKELEDRVPPKKSLHNGLVYKRLSFAKDGRSWLEVVVKREDVAFFIRGGNLSLVRVDGYFTQP